MAKQYFSPETIRFLADLKQNNDRDWFNANKARYEQHIKAPFLSFIGDFGPKLEQISEQFIADPRPNGGSLFRIYRDVRFSKNKDPYKTNAGAHFKHRLGRDVHSPGFYLHVAPNGVFGAAGIWHPDSAALKMIRDAIAEQPERWKGITNSEDISGQYFNMAGDSLKRGPKGYDLEHPLIEDLKRKDFILVHEFDDEQLFEPDFIDQFADLGHRASQYVRFICDGIKVPF